MANQDLHLGNILLRLPSSFNQLSDEELYNKYDAPELEPVTRFDGKPFPQGVPLYAISPVWLGEPSERITLPEAEILISDFGEAFSPLQEVRHKSHSPITIRPPETRFEPDRPLGFSTDIWTLACHLVNKRPKFIV
ncbi:hypothetical protein BKA67DRAFT_532882 [Truncatella angustata]|uniref:Uncharacterized protein n=1 Tax=Truncatella angustata TaxID=152316 RepID=A0A9P8USS8_9PEZI|nr:uncharacterized protein BKA67DRAFT_532882 [Truncatella angustata]KAH6657689.1 hypothetical protein BKA67DRAFT_532882 [Truncatella angustata]